MDASNTGKTSKTRSDKAVQGTNDSSILSKGSSAAAGYFTDSFLQQFAAKKVRRAPLINRGYFIRSWMINHVVCMFLERHGDTKKQIVSLGCGFDTLYFRLKSSGQLTDTVVAEVDFPELMKKKHALIKNNPALNELLGEPQTPAINSPHIELCCTDYKMLGADLTQHNLLEAALRLSGIDFDLPTLILSECVLTYMTKRCASEVIRWAADTFQENGLFVLYEQILPNDSFGLFMQKHYNVIGAPLKCINNFPTLESQKNRVVSLGWTWCEAYDMNEIYHKLVPSSERERVELIEPFDEYEEWHLKCSHYFVLCAYSSQCPGLLGGMAQISTQPNATIQHCSAVSEILLPAPLTPLIESSATLQRFSHSSSLVSGRYLITIGGFGMQDGKHQRVSDVAVTDVITMTTHIYKPKEHFEFPRMHHSSVVLKDGTVLVICGRNSPFSLCVQLISFKFSISQKNQCEHSRSASSTPLSSSSSTLTSSATIVNPDSQDSNQNSLSQSEETKHKPFTTLHEIPVANTEISSVVGSTSNEILCDKPVNCDSDKSDSHVDKAVCDYSKSDDMVTARNNGVLPSTVRCERGSCDADTTGKVKHSECSIDNNQKSNDMVTTSSNGILPSTIHKECRMSRSGEAENGGKVIQLDCNVGNRKSGDTFMASNNGVLPGTVQYECQMSRSGDAETAWKDMQLECSIVQQTGDVPCPRWRHATAVINMKGKEYVFLYGGRTSTETALDDGYLLDTERNTWEKLSCEGNLPGFRQSHTLKAWSPGRLVLAGGLNKDLIPVSSIYILHLESRVWQCLDMVGMDLSRYSHTAHIVQDDLVLVGGVNCSSSSPGISVINLTSGIIRNFSFPIPDKDHLLLCNKHTSVLQDGRLILVGGGGNCFSFGTLLNRSPITLDINKCFISS